MIKNIPYKYTKHDILNDLNKNCFQDKYDFFYLIPDLAVIINVNSRKKAIEGMLLLISLILSL